MGLQEKAAWARGSLPAWAQTIMLGLLGWALVHLASHIETTLAEHTKIMNVLAITDVSHDGRLSALENANKDMREVQKAMLTELKEMNRELKIK